MKYLGVKIDDHLTWKSEIDRISTKHNKANAILSKKKFLKAMYHAIFESHLYYSSLVWAQNFNSTITKYRILKLFILQKKH